MEEPLTERQLEIMNLAKLGYMNKQIADRLDVGIETISTIMSRDIFPHLGALNRAHAVYICMKRGLID